MSDRLLSPSAWITASICSPGSVLRICSEIKSHCNQNLQQAERRCHCAELTDAAHQKKDHQLERQLVTALLVSFI